MKKIFILLTLVILLVMPSSAQTTFHFGSNSPIRKLQMAEMLINGSYVDSVDESKLVEGGIRGMLKELDPHSSYSTPEETKAMTESLGGDFDGIGVQFNMLSDTLVVVKTIRRGPSEKAGILPGDRIVWVNDSLIAGVKMPQMKIVHRLRGKKGTKVHLGVIRPGVDDRLNFTVRRDEIPLHSVEAAYMVEPGVGYVYVSSFGEKTHREFMNAVKSLLEQGMTTLILDLQNNGGGLLGSAVAMAGEFLHNRDVIVSMHGLRTKPRVYDASGEGNLVNLKTYVLVNEYTASAAEIVSGALQDHDRATIVGRRTFGKGLVQHPFNFSDGSMIRVTIAHYYTPSGRCIQKPYKKGNPEAYARDIENRLKHGELTNADSIHFDEKQKFYTLVKHRTVYGGGGIMPDEFVPLDTMKFTKFHRQLVARNVILENVMHYIDNNRKSIKKTYPSFEAYRDKFTVPSSLINGIVASAKTKKITPKDSDELQRTMPMLRLQLRSLICDRIFDMNSYMQLWNEQNDALKDALKLINNQ